MTTIALVALVSLALVDSSALRNAYASQTTPDAGIPSELARDGALADAPENTGDTSPQDESSQPGETVLQATTGGDYEPSTTPDVATPSETTPGAGVQIPGDTNGEASDGQDTGEESPSDTGAAGQAGQENPQENPQENSAGCITDGYDNAEEAVYETESNCADASGHAQFAPLASGLQSGDFGSFDHPTKIFSVSVSATDWELMNDEIPGTYLNPYHLKQAQYLAVNFTSGYSGNAYVLSASSVITETSGSAPSLASGEGVNGSAR